MASVSVANSDGSPELSVKQISLCIASYGIVTYIIRGVVNLTCFDLTGHLAYLNSFISGVRPHTYLALACSLPILTQVTLSEQLMYQVSSSLPCFLASGLAELLAREERTGKMRS